jgi:lipopolysaccharide/colanic/teichoic acid biosynthesis glycosyltransferase
MRQILGFGVLPEMLGLWILETCICFFALLLTLGGSEFVALQISHPIGMLNEIKQPIGMLHTAAADALLLALTVGLVGFALGLYRPVTCLETRRLLFKAAVGALASLPAVWLVSKVCDINLAEFFGVEAGWLGALLAWGSLLLVTRLLYKLAVHMGLMVRRVAIIGAPQAVTHMVEAISGLHRAMFRVEAIQSPAGFRPSLLPDRLWGVVFADTAVPGDLPPRIRRFDAETFWEDQLGRIDTEAAARRDDCVPEFARAAATSPVVATARRLVGVAVATLLLLLTAPVLLVTALLVKLESPGPVIYRQERVGLNGRRFTLFKIRSMRNDAERHGPCWATLGDSRVTAFGRFIRKVRIDELPQLFNILRGDMCLIGPRPERPHFSAQLAEVIPLYHERSLVKPGLTGWAQVNYPYGASVEDARAKLSYDLYYIKHRSIAFDLLILLATVRVILFQEGSR